MKNLAIPVNLHLAGDPAAGNIFPESITGYRCRKSSGWRLPPSKQFLLVFLIWALGASRLYGQNAIVTENEKPGNPASEWQVSGAGDLSIQGFATDISYNKGETARFKIKTNAAAYTIRIYRLGYYQGNGARFQGNATVTASLPQSQPNCLTNAGTGLIDCGNWNVSAQWAIPATAVSGVYIARLIRSDTQGASHVVFIVRDDAGTADLFFQTSDATWQAYNVYGDRSNGKSLYTGAGGKASKVSYNRPFITRQGGGGGGPQEDWLFNAEYPMIRWIEANGYSVSYTTNVDSDRRGNLIANHKVFLSVGHDEYWSGRQRQYVTAARNAGTHLAFFSGNEVYWKTRWENSIDASGTAYRTLVCYKEGSLGENVCNGPCDPSSEWTGLWRSGCEDLTGDPVKDGCQPENALTGQISWAEATGSLTVPSTFKSLRFWRNTSVASLANGQTATLTYGIIGYEWDQEQEQYRASYPAGRIILSRTLIEGETHHLSLYRHSSGALVFGAGTVQYSWGLDSNHDRGNAAPSQALRQATVNLFADMGAQPGSLQSGLVAASPSSDTQAPAPLISSPAENASLPLGTALTISGTASDAGVVAGVEISTDGGSTWRLATGTTNWTYTWTPTAAGAATIRARAFDDSGNMSSPVTRNVNVVGGTYTCPCSVFLPGTAPAGSLQNDGKPIQLGMKFRSSVNGMATGMRFYKQSGNTGTHIGQLYSSTGGLLAQATFSNETASGWQQVNFSTPVTITANTTYVVSYHSSGGYYSVNDQGFAQPVVNGPLTGLQNGVDGPNGLFLYTNTPAYPTSNYAASNYFVDVVFNTSTQNLSPTVSLTSPANGASFTAPATIALAATASDADGSVAKVEFFQGSTKLGEDLSSPYTFSWTNVAAGSYTLTARATDNEGALTTSSQITVTVNGTTACPCTVFQASDAPPGSLQNDGRALQLGMKFRSSVSGYVTGVRFYKQSGNTGTHIGQLYSSTGSLLAQATFSNETASGWQQVNFSTPVTITANTTYVISYHSSGGYYSVDDLSFNQAIVNGPLSGLQNGTDGPNGVYLYTNTPAYPTSNFGASNYLVDVVFTGSSGASNAPPTVSLTSPANGASFTAPATIALAATASDADGSVAKVEFFQGSTKLGEDLSSPYTFSWTNVAAGSYTLTARATDNEGALTTSSQVTVTVDGTSECPCTVFQASVAPAGSLQAEGQPLQMGMKFRSSVSGYVTGVRFYKQSGNTGTHIGQLYSSTGSLLAQATFSNETASGWQQVAFSTPVAITANTTYVVSYHSSSGYYSVDDLGFNEAVVNGPLTGLQKGTDGPNGVYRYTNTPAYPTSNYAASNYFVDVVFDTRIAASSSAARLDLALPLAEHQEGIGVYPNPFSEKTTVRFVLGQDGAYTLDLYDAKGRRVAVLQQGAAKAGEQQALELDGSSLARGLYLVRLQTKAGARTARLIRDR